MHNAGFVALGMPWHYAVFDVLPQDLAKAIAGARALGMRGLNVTAPHKAAAAGEVDRLEGVAAELGLVNTIVFGEGGGGEATGHSTDGEGFLRACADRGWSVGPRMRAVVVGAGGAGMSVAHTLLRRGARVVLANRDSGRLAEAMERLGPRHGRLAGMTLGNSDLSRELRAADLLVVAITASADLALLLDRLRADARVIDLAYAPEEPPAVAAARARGLEAANGLGMLVHQGALSFTLWTGREAPRVAMAEAVGYSVPSASA